MKTIIDKEYYAIAERSSYGGLTEMYISGTSNEFHSHMAALLHAEGMAKAADGALAIIKVRKYDALEIMTELVVAKPPAVPLPPPVVAPPVVVAPLSALPPGYTGSDQAGMQHVRSLADTSTDGVDF